MKLITLAQRLFAGPLGRPCKMATPSPIFANKLARRAAYSSGGKTSVMTGWAPSVADTSRKNQLARGRQKVISVS
jgi:hypothetical protein